MRSAGNDFVAKVRLTDLPGKVLALPGELCDRVPESSLGWLEEQGLIERVPEAAVQKPAPRKAKE